MLRVEYATSPASSVYRGAGCVAADVFAPIQAGQYLLTTLSPSRRSPSVLLSSSLKDYFVGARSRGTGWDLPYNKFAAIFCFSLKCDSGIAFVFSS